MAFSIHDGDIEEDHLRGHMQCRGRWFDYHSTLPTKKMREDRKSECSTMKEMPNTCPHSLFHDTYVKCTPS